MKFIKIFFFVFIISILYSQTYLEKKEFENLVSIYKKGEYKKALNEFKNFLKKYPGTYYLPDVYYYIAILEEDYYSAVIYFKELTLKFPEYEKSDEALYRLGKLYFLHNNYTEAINTFENLQNRYPKSYFIYGSNYWLGIVHLLKNDYEVSIKYFDKVLNEKKKDKFYFLSFLNKGNALYEMGNYKDAIDIFNSALKESEKNYIPSIYLGLANCYMKLKDYENAYNFYKNILKEYPGSPEYEIAYKQIKFIEDNKTIFDKLNVKKIFETPQKKVSKEVFYSVRVSSVKEKRFANDFRIRLKIQGYDAFMKSAIVGNERFYRTYIGKFKTKEEAEKLKEEVKIKLKLQDIFVEKIEE